MDLVRRQFKAHEYGNKLMKMIRVAENGHPKMSCARFESCIFFIFQIGWNIRVWSIW
jgi:hypothetical protein